MTTSPKQVSLFVVKWKPKAGQPIPWEIKQKLCKPKGGRNKKGDIDNFHNRDYDFVSPKGEIFTGKGVRRFAALHGLSESALLDVLNGRVHSCKGWTKAVGGRKLPVPPTYYFLSPSGEIHTTTNLSEFARQHGLCPAMLSRISRCLKATHRGWRHCTPDGQPIVPPDIKHRKFTLLSPTGEIIEGSNLKAFAEQNSLSRGCLMNVLDGTSKEHKGWKLPVISPMTTAVAPNLGKLFTSCTKRPATAEDIALLNPGDWISERDCPWSWQFKNSCQDMAIGVWEGKEFFVPHHLLMVCEIIEGQVVEKFFKKPEPKFKVGDRLLSDHPITKGEIVVAQYPIRSWDGKQEVENSDFVLTTENNLIHVKYLGPIGNHYVSGFRIGDRIQYKVYPPGLGPIGEIVEVKAHLISARMDDGKIYELDPGILKHWEEGEKFKKGDRVRDTFPSSKGRTGIITKASEQWSMVLWDDTQKPERWSHLEKVSAFKVGDRVEFLCDVNFGDINTKARNPNAKLAFTGECAEVCGVRGTRLALSIGGDPFDWPIRLVKRISSSPKGAEVGDACGNSNLFEAGERFAVTPGVTNECEIIEGRVVEKFFKKPEVQDLKQTDDAELKVGDRISILKTRTQNLSEWIGKTATVTGINGETISVAAGEGREKKHLTLKKGWYEIAPLELTENERTQQFKVGDRVKWRDAPQSIYEVVKPEKGGHVTIELVKNPNIKPKPPHRKRVALWEIQLAERPARGTDLGFKVGQRIVSKHPLSLGKTFVVEEYPDEYASGLLDYNYLVTNTNLVLHVGKVCLVNEDSWNPADFGEVPHQIEASGQATIFYDASGEPPEPDDFETIEEYKDAWEKWQSMQVVDKKAPYTKYPDHGALRQIYNELKIKHDESKPRSQERKELADKLNVAKQQRDEALSTIHKMFDAEALQSPDYRIHERMLNFSAHDINCKSAIAIATIEQLEYALGCLKIPNHPGAQKTRIQAIESRLRKLEKECTTQPVAVDKPYWRVISGLHPQSYSLENMERDYIRCDILPIEKQIKLCQQRIRGQRWLSADLKKNCKCKKDREKGIEQCLEAINGEKDRIKQLLKAMASQEPAHEGIERQIQLCQERIIQHNWHIQNLEAESKQTKAAKEAIKLAKSAIASELERIDQLLEELIIYRQLRELVGEDEAKKMTLKIIANQNHTQPASD